MLDIEKTFVPKNIAIKLREIGFDEFCLFYYEHNKTAPRFGLESKSIKNKVQFRIIKINAHTILQSKNSKIDIAVPSYEQVFAWFRSKGLFHSITIKKDPIVIEVPFYCEIRNSKGDVLTFFYKRDYEEAKVDSIKILIDIYKDIKQESKKK